MGRDWVGIGPLNGGMQRAHTVQIIIIARVANANQICQISKVVKNECFQKYCKSEGM